MANFRRYVSGLSGALALSMAGHAHAQSSPAPVVQAPSYALSTAAYKDYMLQCAGCHRFDGMGVDHRSVPSFRNSIGLLTRLPAGRDYMIRVPGAAQSRLGNAELANVLNWIVATYSPQELPPDFKPFTPNEVGTARPYRFDDVAPVRRALSQQLREQGYELSTYTFGHNAAPPD